MPPNEDTPTRGGETLPLYFRGDRGEADHGAYSLEHEMGVIERITDRCAVLNFGQKICEGSYQEVAADPLVQEAYLGIE